MRFTENDSGPSGISSGKIGIKIDASSMPVLNCNTEKENMQKVNSNTNFKLKDIFRNSKIFILLIKTRESIFLTWSNVSYSIPKYQY